MRGAVLNPNFEPQQWNTDWKELIVDLIQRGACNTQTSFLGFLKAFGEIRPSLGVHVLKDAFP